MHWILEKDLQAFWFQGIIRTGNITVCRLSRRQAENVIAAAYALSSAQRRQYQHRIQNGQIRKNVSLVCTVSLSVPRRRGKIRNCCFLWQGEA